MLSLIAVLGFVSVAFVNSQIPTFPDQYHAKGRVRLPYAELDEPYEIWYDGPHKNSRVDWYDGMDKTIVLGDSIQYKYYYFDGKKACARLNGASLTTVLPDLKDYKYNGLHSVDGCKNKCHMLQSQTINGQENSTYRFYYEFDSAGNPIPRLFWFLGWDKLLGSHFDRYDIIYDKFDGNVSSGSFNITGNCHSGYPKKGDTDEEQDFSLNPISHYMDQSSHKKIKHIFRHFKGKYNKRYGSHKEDSSRYVNFVKNLRFVHSKNRAGLSYELAINHLADLHEHELRMMTGFRQKERSNEHLVDPDAKWFDKSKFLATSTIPTSWDWRQYGAVTPIKDQAICGTCWAFSATENLEGLFFKQNGWLEYLAVQQISDCSWAYGNHACDGGNPSKAFKYIADFGGVETVLNYGQYLGQDGICHANKSKAVLQISGYTRVDSQDNDALMVALVEEGPISISINAAVNSFYFYSRGVYDDPACKGSADDLDHSVLLVGFGTLNGTPYWLVKNSWSNYWGDDGYVLVERDDQFICGIATQPLFANA